LKQYLIIHSICFKKINLAQQTPSENAKDYVYIENIHDNVNYTLWSFNLNKQTIRILIRSSVDGYVNTKTSSVNVTFF
jgi:hypothetical protein